jgi:NodT family efflux transporter outer membrane factor (OMF) lipoprotein
MFNFRMLILSVVALSGCVSQTAYVVPKVELPATVSDVPGLPRVDWVAAAPADLQDRGDWWQVFADPQLAALERRATDSNQSIEAAMARLLQARSEVKSTRAEFFPIIGADVAGSRQRTSANVAGRSLADKTTNDFSTGLDVSWEPDLFGKVRQALQSAEAREHASAADFAAVRLSIQAQLAIDYFDLRDALRQQAILEETVASLQRAGSLVQVRFNAGIASELDVAQSDTQLQATQAQLQDISIRVAQLQHAIATVTNDPGSRVELTVRNADSTVPVTADELPSVLLQRRPDIAAAERRVFASYSDVEVARAAFFPDLLLTAAGGRESSTLANWATLPSRFWTVGPALVGTLFDGGRRQSQVDSARARNREAIADYRAVVLGAFQEVQDQLTATKQLRTEAQLQAAAVTSAERALRVAMDRYRAGAVSYLEVVTAQSTALQNERAAADVSRRQLEATVRLIKAVGGPVAAG